MNIVNSALQGKGRRKNIIYLIVLIMFFTSTNFLKFGGLVLVVVGLLGFVGIIGPTSSQSLFGAFWWFDNYENVVHLLLGIVGLVVAFALPMSLHKPVTLLVGVLALFFALYNLFSVNFLGANLESPADLVLHTVVAAWALYSSLGNKSSM